MGGCQPHDLGGGGLARMFPRQEVQAAFELIDLFYHVGKTRYEWHGHIQIALTSVARIPGS